ncbi:acyl-CoA thioesterase [Phaeodactylibacter luteus]|uniref:Acyl-CoA thioesterase n=1 Tax=Phaeodactylibacter luteus TaxID=1564516 RepID=A0A5C6RIZ7_9BACT|nr:thioesterase family protein [Phaeodactylibacter luteus]TXB62271.1 acyl-CoA thioesterase [Phaeodactylibacter luteus]
MYTNEFQKRVRYGETDQMGYLYYGNYPQYYEIGRVEMLRSLGLTYKAMEEEEGILMPVVSMQIRYVRPAHYDELINIRTTLRQMPGRYITFHMELFNEAGKLLNGASVKLCFVDRSTGKTIPAPALLTDKLRPYFEAA